MPTEKQTCANCDGDLPKGSHQFCSDKCRFEHTIFELRNQTLSLEEKIRLLNCQRTAITPDMGLTAEANVQAARFNSRVWINEMDNDTLFVYHEMVRAIAEESFIVITRKRIKNENDTKVKSDFSKAVEKRETQDLSPKELFTRKCMKEGFSTTECNTLWAKESKKEKAIAQLMKMPGMTRDKAMQMLKLVPDGLNGKELKS